MKGSVVKMNKSWKKTINFLSIGLIGGMIFTPIVQVQANETSVQAKAKEDDYSSKATAAYKTADKLIKEAVKSKKVGDIRKAYESFILITPEMNAQNYGAYSPEDKMDQVFFDVRDLLYKHTPKENRNKEIIRFAEQWAEVLIENSNSLYTHHFSYLVSENTIKPIQKELDEMLTELNRYVNGTPSEDGVIPLPTEDEMDALIKDYFDKYGSDKEDDPKAPTEKETDDEINKKYPQDDNIASETIRYEKSGNDWYEITDLIKNGKVIKSDSRKMSVEESYFLRVQEDPYYGFYNDFNAVNYMSDSDWTYITNDQNQESKYTIQYTVNKDEATPYYYDTGIRVNENKQATFEQFKDILLVMADKMGGHFVEDKSKLLIVLEGKPIVVYDDKELYSKKELESLFSQFKKADIRIMETRIGKTGSLEEQIVSKQAKTVQVDGVDIVLEANPMVENERALLPFDEIVYALGGTPDNNNDSYIAKKGKTTVTFRLKDSSVYVNGKAIPLTNAPVYKENILFVEVSEMATALGYSMSWDSETSTIYFEKR